MYRITSEEEKRILDFFYNMHQYPEISNQEFNTTKNIKEFLNGIDGVEILPLEVETGVLAIIRGENKGPTIGLRCDIDAINQTERYKCEYSSKNEGVMHACGHDFHTASLLGAALILGRNKSKMNGNAVLLFQKAEETTTGAEEMIEAGLFELSKAEMFFGLHNWPLVPAGKVICKKGALMSAKTNFEIEVIGRGGHGSMPHLNIDPIVCASAIVMSLQTVLSRNIDPFSPMVFSINSINGGSVDNLVVDNTKMTATIRSLSSESMLRAKERMEKIVRDTCSAYECEYKITYKEDIPLTFNSDKMYDLAVKAAEKVVSKSDIVDVQATMASEDFAKIMQRVPSFMYWFGSGKENEENKALHDQYYHADESGIKVAAEVLASAVITAQSF
ncbi:M20 metallopeptidase family protein [Peptoniphilus asaccharolyticus]